VIPPPPWPLWTASRRLSPAPSPQVIFGFRDPVIFISASRPRSLAPFNRFARQSLWQFHVELPCSLIPRRPPHPPPFLTLHSFSEGRIVPIFSGPPTDNLTSVWTAVMSIPIQKFPRLPNKVPPVVCDGLSAALRFRPPVEPPCNACQVTVLFFPRGSPPSFEPPPRSKSSRQGRI